MAEYNWRQATVAESIKWFKKNLRTLNYKNKLSSKFEIGNIYLYKYDPKLKDTLPYYDTIPIVLILDMHKGGFLGLNFHYLPPDVRLRFVKKIKKFKVEDLFLLNYIDMKNYPVFKEYKVCIKQYLYSHVRSTIKYIPPEEWEFVASLSLEQFMKETKEEVWKNSALL